MRKFTAVLWGLGVALALAINVAAQTPVPSSASPAMSAQRLALAQQVVDAARLPQSAKLAIEVLMRPFIQQMSSGEGSAAFKAYTVDLFRTEIETMVKQIEPMYADIYARTFSDQELADVLAFYRSPTGLMLIQKQPELARESQLAVAPLVPKLQRDLIEKLFAHICELQVCTPEQRRQVQGAKEQLLSKLAAQQSLAPVSAPSP